MNTTQTLFEVGQSIWYDNIQRSLLQSGAMTGMIARGEIRGVTSNPTIFMNAISKSQDYDSGLLPHSRASYSTEEIFYNLAIADIQAAADLFLPLYDQSGGGDGYVSLEVSPYLADDTQASFEEAKRLWQWVNKPNLMVKIPATKAGLPAITQAISEGLNINVTLIFSRQRYAEVMDAYITGLEKRAAQGLPVASIASVASFFVSRVDTKVDVQLEKIVQGGSPHAEKAAALFGKAAIANARLAYADFKEVFAAERFQQLKRLGARVQRPLWASTGTKNPKYSDVMYVDGLIGPQTVNTVPPQTLAAFLDHGNVHLSLEEDLDGSRAALAGLEALGIHMADVTWQLEAEGVKTFADSFTALLNVIEERRASL